MGTDKLLDTVMIACSTVGLALMLLAYTGTTGPAGALLGSCGTATAVVIVYGRNYLARRRERATARRADEAMAGR